MMNNDRSQQLNDLKNLLGSELLAFMLGVNETQLDNIQLSNVQEQALEKIVPAIDTFKGQSEFERPLNVAHVLCSYVESLDTSWSVYLHYICMGMNVPDLSHIKDSAERSIMTVARDTYAGLLIKRDRFGVPTMFTSSYAHPSARRFNADIMRSTNPIRKFFPGALTYREYKANPDKILSLHRNMILSNGHGGTISAGMILESILSSSVFLHEDTRDPVTEYCDSVRLTYRRLRRSLGKNKLNISTVVGLSNVDINEDNFRISQNIVLRKPTKIDMSATFGDAGEPSLIIEINNNVDILESYANTDEDSNNPFARYDKYKSDIDLFYQQQQKDINNVRLAMLLSSKEKIIAPGYVFTTSLSPISLGRSSAISPYRWPSVRYERQVLDLSAKSSIRRWFSRLNQLPDTLDVSVKRLISAATERLDDVDAFIDAVMVWENLFGARQETTFRISSSLAVLLEPKDAQKRKALLKEVKKLYGRRSELVHGRPNVKVSEIEKEKTRAIEIAIEALRIVISSKRLTLVESSEDRGSILLLGIPSESK